MSLPTPRDPSTNGALVRFEPRVDEPEIRLGQVIPALRRSKWIVLACAAISVSGAWLYSRSAKEVYEAEVSVQIEEKQSAAPDVLRMFSPNSDVSTDMQVLGSRTLVEDAARILGLQVRLIAPEGVPRDRLLSEIKVTPDAEHAEYQLTRRRDGSFEVSDEDSLLTRTRPGEPLALPGVALRLTAEAANYPELRFLVRSFSEAVEKTPVSVDRAGNERDLADIIKLRYEDTDQGLVWKVPNIIAERFIERRREAQASQSRSQAKFLRQQLDTLAAQLATAEEELRTFRERSRVVSPEVEANSQINRLVNLQAERSSLEAERSALASLVQEVEARQQQRAPGKPSAYRELLAFPSLLRNQAASQLLSSLSSVENERATLLTRRTEADPDVQLLSQRIVELETQLKTMAVAYLEGISNQLTSLDAAIARFGGELGQMPRKELQFARLERKPQVLKELYTLLQTRLKEAEIAEAAVNSNVSIVDPAIPPRAPMASKTLLLMLAGLVGGTLLGIGLTILREYADHSIKTRSDATAASGLPVMAIVPRIPRQSHRGAIIARRSTARKSEPPIVHPQRDPRGTSPEYTFLAGASLPENPAEVPTAKTDAQALVARHAPGRMSLSRGASAVAEAYAILQTNITFSRPEEQLKVLALTSALPGEGKTTTAVNLALTLCQRGLSVCLVDADLRRPQLHEIFHVPREPGLSEVLKGLRTFESASRPMQIGEGPQLAVLTAGAPGLSAPALVGSTRMRTLLNELRNQFDLVILDTPPVNILTDAALLGVNADGVLVVVRAGATDAAALHYAMEQLNHVRAPALGIVMNDVDLKRFGAYDGAYRYYGYGTYTDAGSNQS